MGGQHDKAEGKAKELLGKVTDDKSLEGEGKAQNLGGKVKQVGESVKGAGEGVKEAVTGDRDPERR
jgi:uncharacterized protein YjbJ (UPF0337 family)